MLKHKIILGLNIAVFLAMVYIFFTYPIPENIPTHYNINAEADSYGNKNSLWILMGIQIAISITLHYIILHPEKANYPYEITEENKETSHRKMKNSMAVLSVFFSGLFFTIFINSTGILDTKNYLQYGVYACLLIPPPYYSTFLYKKINNHLT